MGWSSCQTVRSPGRAPCPRVDAVDVDVPLSVLVARGLDEAMGCGHHFQAHHEGQTHGAGAVGVAGGGFKSMATKSTCWLAGRGSDGWPQISMGITPIGGRLQNRKGSEDPSYYSILRADVKVSTGDFPCGVDRTEKRNCGNFRKNVDIF